MAAAVHRKSESEMRVVIKIGAGGDDPVDEAGLDQRNDRRNAETRGRQSAGQSQADGDVVIEHALGEELSAFTQPRGVVGLKIVFYQLNDRSLFGDRRRGYPPALQKSALVH